MRGEILQVHAERWLTLRFRVGTLLVRAASDFRVSAGDFAKVEFDIRGTASLVNAAPSERRSYSVENVEDKIRMCGLVDGVDPDGMIYFRLGTDSLTLIESEPGTFARGEWLSVEFPTQVVDAYLSGC